MPLKLTTGNIDLMSQDLSVEFHEGTATVSCSITREVLLDLGSYHRLSFTEQEVIEVLLPEIERLVKAKFSAGRLEENGNVVIKPADLLRYGFCAPA